MTTIHTGSDNGCLECELEWRELGTGEVADHETYELSVFPSEGLVGYQVVSHNGLEIHGEVDTVKEAKKVCLDFLKEHA